jgi:hypothetical protein
MQVTKFGVTRALAVIATASALGLTLCAQTAVAGGESGDAPLTVVKTVSGPVAAGTTFTATIQCDDTIIDDGGEGTDSATVTFDASGQPTSPDTMTFGGPGTCTVTETASGGATTTTAACESSVPVLPPQSQDGFSATAVGPDDPVCPVAGPQAAPITVNIVNPEQTATVTIANTFVVTPLTPLTPVVQPAAAIAAAPAFTG